MPLEIMKPLWDTVLFIAWVSAYLTAVAWISRYRRARAQAPGLEGQTDYRPDKDIGLNLAIFALGVVLFILMFLAIKAVGRSF
jgi:hypothetical protein